METFTVGEEDRTFGGELLADLATLADVCFADDCTGINGGRLSDDEIFSSAQEVAVEVPNVSIPDSANEPPVLESEPQTASSVSQANSVAPTISYSDDIEIAFVEDCWTEIRDATGKILFSGVKSKGSQLSLTGQSS